MDNSRRIKEEWNKSRSRTVVMQSYSMKSPKTIHAYDPDGFVSLHISNIYFWLCPKSKVRHRGNCYFAHGHHIVLHFQDHELCSTFSSHRGEWLTSLLISSCLSGAERAVALIMVDVWLSVSFFMQRWPATILQTWRPELYMRYK